MSIELAASPSRAMTEIDELIRELRIAIESHLPYYTNLVRLLAADEQDERAERFVRPPGCRLEARLEEILPVKLRDPSPDLHLAFGVRDALRYWMSARAWSSYWYLCTYHDRDEWSRDWELITKVLPLPEQPGASRQPSLENPWEAAMIVADSLCKLMEAIKRYEATRGARGGGAAGEGSDKPRPDRSEWLSLSNGERLKKFMANRERASYEEVIEAVLGPGGRASDTTVRTWVRRANSIESAEQDFTLRCRDRCVIKDN